MDAMAREARDRLVRARAAQIRAQHPIVSPDEADRIAWWDFDQAYEGQRLEELRDVQMSLVDCG